MQKNNRTSISLATALLSAALVVGMLVGVKPAAAAVNIVQDSSFEFGNLVSSGGFSTYSTGGSFGAWNVTGGSVDLINGYWQANDGTYSVDMSGTSAGTITQNLVTTPGSTYNLSFALAGNPGGDLLKSLSVDWDGSAVTGSPFIFDATGKSTSNMGWTIVTVNGLVASGSSTALSFISNNNSVYGPALDSVSVTAASTSAVPEPASWAVFALGGLGLVGFALRRKSMAS